MKKKERKKQHHAMKSSPVSEALRYILKKAGREREAESHKDMNEIQGGPNNN